MNPAGHEDQGQRRQQQARSDGQAAPGQQPDDPAPDSAQVQGMLHRPQVRQADRDAQSEMLRHSQAALEASEAAYRAMFEANPQPMWVYALDSLVFLAVNDAAVAHYGYRREEFLGMTIRDIRPSEDVTRLDGTFQQLGVGGIRHVGQWSHRRKDGSLILVEITSHDLVFDHRPSRLVLAYDVTERERALAKLREQRDALERFNGLAVDRELAMIQLKQQVNALSRQLGQAAPFDLAFVDDPAAFEARHASMPDGGAS